MCACVGVCARFYLCCELIKFQKTKQSIKKINLA